MYHQDSEKQFNDFNASVTSIVNILKFQNKELFRVCEKVLIKLIGHEETMHVFNAAMFQLAQISPECCNWAWQNFPEYEIGLELKDEIIMSAVQKLMQKGFLLGKDFSTTFDGGILITQEAKIALMVSCQPFEWSFIKEVMQVVQPCLSDSYSSKLTN
jgi:hypothetical protein